MGLAHGYLGTLRGRVSIVIAVIAVAAAFTLLAAITSAPGQADVGTVAILGLVVLVAELALAVGVTDALRTRLVELATLRALGWPRRRVRLGLMLSFAMIGSLVGVLALPLTWAARAVLGHGWLAGWPESGWRLAAIPGALALVIAGAWWPVRQALDGEGGANREDRAGRAGAEARAGASTAGGGRAAGWPVRAATKDMVLKGIVITGAGMALSLELAVRWAWLSHPVPGEVGLAEWGAVAVIALLAVATVGDLDWLAAQERAGESRTLRAMGWSARRMAWAATLDAARLGVAGAIVAAVLDVAGSLAVAHRLPHRMLAVVAIVAAVSLVISLLAAGLAAIAQLRHRGS